MEYIMSQGRIKSMVLSSDKVKVIAGHKKNGGLKDLKNLIYFDTLSEADKSNAEANGLTVYSMHELIEEGQKLNEQEANYNERDVKPETVYTISYTSGTTGTPKGVMLTQRNMACQAGNFTKHDTTGVLELRPGQDVYISYLPLAHVFERVMYAIVMTHGV
jgi:long-chain acyl-CoA synthetase